MILVRRCNKPTSEYELKPMMSIITGSYHKLYNVEKENKKLEKKVLGVHNSELALKIDGAMSDRLSRDSSSDLKIQDSRFKSIYSTMYIHQSYKSTEQCEKTNQIFLDEYMSGDPR